MASEAFWGHLLSEYEPKRLSWRSRNRLAKGKITIIDGDPGLGKSTLLADWAARVTRGEALFDGDVQPETGVIMLNAEDDPADTIRPRFDAAGGDADRLLILNELPVTNADGEPVYWPSGDVKTRWFGFPDDASILEEAIGQMNAGLVFVDPLMAFLSPDVKSNNDQDVRRALSVLSLIAQRTGVSVVLIRHLNKSGGVNALYRGGGSIGIIGLARIGLLLGRHKDDENLRVLAGVKNNIGPLAKSLGFKLEAVPGTDIARMVYVGEVDVSASDLLLGDVEAREEADEADECTEWLREYLTQGPREKTDIIKQRNIRGFSQRALQRAYSKLKITSKPGGFGGAWIWEMPSPITTVKDANITPIRKGDIEYESF
jgi:hypothetical protein